MICIDDYNKWLVNAPQSKVSWRSATSLLHIPFRLYIPQYSISIFILIYPGLLNDIALWDIPLTSGTNSFTGTINPYKQNSVSIIYPFSHTSSHIYPFSTVCPRKMITILRNNHNLFLIISHRHDHLICPLLKILCYFCTGFCKLFSKEFLFLYL